ncbi:putative Zinc transporter 9 [Helianthus debilis subsp. tardiflorus]
MRSAVSWSFHDRDIAPDAETLEETNANLDEVVALAKELQVVDSVYDCESEVIEPGFFRFKAEIDFNGVTLVQNYLSQTGPEEWAKKFRNAAKEKDDSKCLRSCQSMVKRWLRRSVVKSIGLRRKYRK